MENLIFNQPAKIFAKTQPILSFTKISSRMYVVLVSSTLSSVKCMVCL